MSNKKKVLLFTDWYLPGYKAGGPIQSCRNIVELLRETYDFYIVTSDRDLGETQPYPGIKRNTWVLSENGTQIFYSTPGQSKHNLFRDIITNVEPDVIYLNSMFSSAFTLLPLLVLKLMKWRKRVVLAPRGMLHAGAIKSKQAKKRAFLFFLSKSRLAQSIVFHATDPQERSDIASYFPRSRVMMASNIPNKPTLNLARRNKQPLILKCISISRIHPHKNLDFALSVLQSVSTTCVIQFDIFGTIDDRVYYEKCLGMAAEMPANCEVRFKGALEHSVLFDALRAYHLFFLPTASENFGHAIFEALSTGCPVLISDQTPWQDVEQHNAGWAFPLDGKAAFVNKVEHVCMMDQATFDDLSSSTFNYAKNFINRQDFKNSYDLLFQ